MSFLIEGQNPRIATIIDHAMPPLCSVIDGDEAKQLFDCRKRPPEPFPNDAHASQTPSLAHLSPVASLIMYMKKNARERVVTCAPRSLQLVVTPPAFRCVALLGHRGLRPSGSFGVVDHGEQEDFPTF
jgi:hypothetical protein